MPGAVMSAGYRLNLSQRQRARFSREIQEVADVVAASSWRTRSYDIYGNLTEVDGRVFLHGYCALFAQALVDWLPCGELVAMTALPSPPRLYRRKEPFAPHVAVLFRCRGGHHLIVDANGAKTPKEFRDWYERNGSLIPVPVPGIPDNINRHKDRWDDFTDADLDKIVHNLVINFGLSMPWVRCE